MKVWAARHWRSDDTLDKFAIFHERPSQADLVEAFPNYDKKRDVIFLLGECSVLEKRKGENKMTEAKQVEVRSVEAATHARNVISVSAAAIFSAAPEPSRAAMDEAIDAAVEIYRLSKQRIKIQKAETAPVVGNGAT